MDPQLTCDAFLGGQLNVWQPKSGYRAGVDPVFLAASVPAISGQSVLELGCGAGVASLCLAKRVPDLRLTGLELQPEYADLARRNAQENVVNLNIIDGDLADMPPALKQVTFDHVIANPPYFRRDRSSPATDAGRETAMGEATELEAWVKAAAKRLAPKGYASFIHRAERLGDLLAALNGRLGSVQVLPLVPRQGRDARLVLVRARKGGKAALRLHDSVYLHSGAQHESDQDDYTPRISGVLRNSDALAFPE